MSSKQNPKKQLADDSFIDAQMLATFSNLAPQQIEEFRNAICPDFLPAGFWAALSITPGDEFGEFAWQSVQQSVQKAWSERFSLDTAIQLITKVDKFSKGEQILRQVTGMSNQEIINLRLPTPEVWPFQRAIMYLAVNSWRARFCTRCGKRFVAVRPKSTYCSDACFKESRKGAKQAWWAAHGEQWRANVAKKTTAKTKAKRILKGA